MEPLRFATLGESSSADGFGLSGTLAPSYGGELLQGTFAITGDFRTLVLSRTAWTPLANGGFEQTTGDFDPGIQGFMTLSPWEASPNLLPHGDAEGLAASDGSVSADLPGWVVDGNLAIVPWDGSSSDWLGSAAPGPADRGLNLFYGGAENPSTKATTRVALPASPSRIDAGAVTAELAGWFGGFLGQGDTASLSASFLPTAGDPLGSFQIGSITPTQRTNRTGIVFDSATRILPSGTREIEVTLEMRREAGGGWNDGMADNLRLVLLEDRPGALPGWKVIQSDVRWFTRPNTLGISSPYGDRFLDLAGQNPASEYGGVAQTVATIPDQRYQLTFALGTRQAADSRREPVEVEVVVGAVTHTVSFQPEGTGEAWETFTLEFTATSPATRLAWVGRSKGGSDYLGLDHISLTPATSAEVPALGVATRIDAESAVLDLSFQSIAGQAYRLQTIE
ncbi:MAG: DUF642 domain-containing protein, partial [Verrucomicrobiales bacterium]|nr:DUF642 domain-containing protein [Verrucomicrobiales bacterium]